MGRSSSIKLSRNELSPTRSQCLGKPPTDEDSIPSCSATSRPIRLDKVQAVRRQLADSTYDIDKHLDGTLEKVLRALAVQTAREKIAGNMGQKQDYSSDDSLDSNTSAPSEPVGARDRACAAPSNEVHEEVLTHKTRQGRTMKTHSKTNRKEVFQTVDDGARVAHLDTVPLRPASSRKGKSKTSHGDMAIVGQSPALTHEQIAERARAIWVARGHIPGEDERNWHEAEAQLRRELGLGHPSL